MRCRFGLLKRCQVFIAMFLIASFILPVKALAVDTSKTAFVNSRAYNNLISDDNFISTKSMTIDQIQDFLTSQHSFLKDYSEGGRNAAKIIWDAANGQTVDSTGALNGIVVDASTGTVNPMVILVTLQKEQSMITRTTNPGSSIMNKAMGFGCPDSGGCNPTYSGFTKQIDWAAWQLRYNFHRAETSRTWATNYKVGQTYYHNDPDPLKRFDSAIDVTLSNRATASLYRYTPHVYNGNYNFWKYFNDWFSGWNIPPPNTVVDTTPITMSTYSSSLLVGTVCTQSISPPIGTTVYNVPCPGGGSQKVTIIRHKPADINGDTKIDLLDLSTFATYWGKSKPTVQLANLNPDVDEEVNLLDLSILAANWGK